MEKQINYPEQEVEVSKEIFDEIEDDISCINFPFRDIPRFDSEETVITLPDDETGRDSFFDR